ncbi:MAG TPA: RNA polymerase sigma factor [Gaiellaceae bacterium]
MGIRSENDAHGRPSFDALFSDEVGAIHRYLRRRIGRDAADDVTAATFATAFAHWGSYDPARPLRPWLYGIATNLARRHYRDEERKLRAYARTGLDPIATDDETEAVHRLDANTRRRALAAALGELRVEDREILLLHAWAELNDSEIADALSLPIGTVKSRLHRTREQMRNQLTVDGQPGDEPLSSRKEKLG